MRRYNKISWWTLRILKVLSCVIYGIIVILLAISSPVILGFKPVVVLSGSMLPNYPIGSITYYKQAEFEEINIGDVITFDFGKEALATHRVVEIEESTNDFITKGDNNKTQDPNPVSFQNVQGKTSDIAIPYAGYFMNYIRNLYIIIPCAFILILDILFTKDKKSMKTV